RHRSRARRCLEERLCLTPLTARCSRPAEPASAARSRPWQRRTALARLGRTPCTVLTSLACPARQRRARSARMPELTYREAVRETLVQAMRADEDVFIMGEDIAEMGGSMGVTQGLLDEFGPERVRNTPISEMALAGAAIGAAMQGMRPVVEVMYEDFLTLSCEQIVNQAA